MGLFSFISSLFSTPGASKKIELTKTAAAEGLPIIYGKRRVEPINVFKRVSANNGPTSNQPVYDNYVYRGNSGHDNDDKERNRWLHRVDVWGQGEISAITGFWVDGDPATHKRFNRRPYFRAVSMYGREPQTAISALVSTGIDWTSAHAGNGIAYSWTRFFQSNNHPQFNSEPAIKADIQGLKLYDPRKDETVLGSTGTGHRFDDPSTWVYSNNRALVLLNYMMGAHGFNAPQSELDLQSFMMAADLCDSPMDIPPKPVNTTATNFEIVNPYSGEREIIEPNGILWFLKPDQADGDLTQRRYTADVVLDPKRGVVENIKLILQEFGWSLSWSNGQHKLVVEDAITAPLMTLTADELIGDWNITRGRRSERLNRATVTFRNASKNYENDTVSWPPLRGDTHNALLAEDNGRDLHQDITRESITDYHRAEAYAEFIVRKSRVGERIEGIEVAPKAMLLEPGDVIAIDLPEKGMDVSTSPNLFHHKNLFFVEKVSVTPTLTVRLDLRRYDHAIYVPESRTPEPTYVPDNSLSPWLDPDAITDLNAIEFHDTKADGSVVSGLYVTWTAPQNDVGVERIEVKWRELGDANLLGDSYVETIILPPEATACQIHGLVDDRTYEVTVTYRNRLGARATDTVATFNLAETVATKLADIEVGATNGATFGENVYDLNGFLVESGDLITADRQLAFHLFWDFQGDALGWTGANVTLSTTPDALHVVTDTNDGQLFSPSFSLDGSAFDKVIVRMTRTQNIGSDFWEFPTLYYTTTNDGISVDRRKGANRRFVDGVATTFVFDMADLDAGDDHWRTSTITGLRFDPTFTTGDQFDIDWIGIGQVAPAAAEAAASNLVGDLGFMEFSAERSEQFESFSGKDLTDMGLTVGDVISVGLQVIADVAGSRSGHLRVRFVDPSGTTIADHDSAEAAITGTYQLVSIEGLAVPAGTKRIRFLFVRGAGSGNVGARRLAANKGASLLNWFKPRPDVEDGATDGAIIGTNVRDEDGLILSGNDILTADGLLEFGTLWDFRGDAAGWVATDANITGVPNGLQVTTTSVNAELTSPAVNINGAIYDKVVVRMKRTTPGQGEFFDNPVVHYQTAGHGFSANYRKGRFLRFGDQNARTLVFDMTQLSAGGTDWVSNTIEKLRFDPSTTAGDTFEIDWIGVARIAAPAVEAASNNLADQLSFANIELTDASPQDFELFGRIEFADVLLASGDMISLCCEILSDAARGGRLRLIFEDSLGADLESHVSDYTDSGVPSYQVVALDGRIIPAGATQMRLFLDRTLTGTGTVSARRLMINRGPRHENWYPVRSDVEVGATAGAPTGTLVAGRLAEDVDSDAAIGRALTEDNATTVHPSSVAGVADVTDYADNRIANSVISLAGLGAGALASLGKVDYDEIADGATSWIISGRRNLATFVNNDDDISGALGGVANSKGLHVLSCQATIKTNVGSIEHLSIQPWVQKSGIGRVDLLTPNNFTVTNNAQRYAFRFEYSPNDQADADSLQNFGITFTGTDGSWNITLTDLVFEIRELRR